MRGTITHTQSSATSLLARILDATPAEGLPDPDLARLEARARAEHHKRRKAAWYRAWIVYRYCEHRRFADDFRRVCDRWGARLPSVDAIPHSRARWEWLEAGVRLMLTPAATQTDLRWKRGFLRCIPDSLKPACEAQIAADSRYLAPRAPQHGKAT